MKKLAVAFILGFFACLYWMYCDPNTRKKVSDIFKSCTDEKLKDALDKYKEKNATLKNKDKSNNSDTSPENTT